MKCNNCGAELPENVNVCPNCGTEITVSTPNKKNNKIAMIIGIVAVLLVSFFGINEYMKQNLKNELLRDWSRIEKDSTYYVLELDFHDSYIDYNFLSTFLDENIATFRYEVVSGNTIKVNNRKFKIEFNDDKTMMVISPGLTEHTDHEYWFNL